MSDVRDTPPFRADHVGSLLRPPELLKAREDLAAGRISAEALREVEDKAVDDAIRLQEEIGLRAITDGEYRRATWHMDFLYQIGGATKSQQKGLEVTFHSDQGDVNWTPSALEVTGKLRLEKPIFVEAFDYLRSKVRRGTPKLTIPSPSMMHYRGGRAAIDQSVYPDMDEFWDDLGAVYAEELRVLAEHGCTYLQLDDTSLAYLNDPSQREYVQSLGGDPNRQHLTYIRVMNRALADKPADMVVTTHLCRGNFRSSWVAAGGYDYVADALFNELQVDGFFLEYDDARSGSFEPLRFVPKGKQVVLGLVTTKRPDLESKDELKRRIEEASKYVPLDQICLSPQCGFASTQEGNALTVEDQKAKLRLVVEVADEVWGGH